MAAPIEVESDGSVRDLFKDPPFDLENVRFDVSGQVSEGDLDKETLETLYEQILRAIYDKIGVTDWYPPGQLPNYHEATVTLLMKNHRLIWTDSFTKFTGYRTCDRLAKDITGKGQDLPEDIKNLILCPSAPVLLSYVALAIFRKPPTGSPGKDIISMFCTKKVLKWLRLAIRIYEKNQFRLMYISVDDNYDLDDGRQSEFIERRGKKYICVKSHSVDDSVFQREIDQYFNSGRSLVSDDSDNSDSGWAGLSDHGNLSGDEMDIGSQHVTSNESVRELDSGPQSMIGADIRTLIGTIVENSAKIDASIQNGAELYKQAVLGALQESDIFKTIIKEAIAKLQPQVNHQAVMVGRAVLSALQESDIFKTLIERAVAKLQPRISHSVDDDNNALDEDTQ